MPQTEKLLSIRATALSLGLPPRVIARAIASGSLQGITTTTETGRQRVYIKMSDATAWMSRLPSRRETSDSL